MPQLGYTGGNKYLHQLELEEGVDKVTLMKRDYPEFFGQLGKLNLLGSRTGSAIMLYESGVWKLIIQSRKQTMLAMGYTGPKDPASLIYLFTRGLHQGKSIAWLEGQKIKRYSLLYGKCRENLLSSCQSGFYKSVFKHFYRRI